MWYSCSSPVPIDLVLFSFYNFCKTDSFLVGAAHVSTVQTIVVLTKPCLQILCLFFKIEVTNTITQKFIYLYGVFWVMWLERPARASVQSDEFESTPVSHNVRPTTGSTNPPILPYLISRKILKQPNACHVTLTVYLTVWQIQCSLTYVRGGSKEEFWGGKFLRR